MILSTWLSRPAFWLKGTPQAVYSSSNILSLRETPTPVIRRPRHSTSTLARAWASTTGLRMAASSTAVPIFTRSVFTASAPRVLMTSSRDLAVTLSPIHTES